MLSRLPISLVQLKAGNNSENLKTKLGSYCIFFVQTKKIWSTLFKHRHNLYEHWK